MKDHISGGYILLSRKLIENEIWDKPPLYLKVWIYLLSKAQHKQYKSLKRGQLYTSLKEIAEACSWQIGYRKETPNKDQIYKIIEWLRKPREGGNESNDESNGTATMIATTKATHGILINIENYGFYQDPKSYESNDEDNDENDTKATTKDLRKQQSSNNINKNDKNDKNNNIKKNNKKKYGEFENVILSDDELQKLKNDFSDYEERIERLSGYIASSGKKYKSHYATIRQWAARDKKDVKKSQKIDYENQELF